MREEITWSMRMHERRHTALPTTVPKPTALCCQEAQSVQCHMRLCRGVRRTLKVPTNEVKSSGAEPPAAMKVAPATSSLRFRFLTMTWGASCHSTQPFQTRLVADSTSRAGTKYSSQTIASARNM